MAESAKAVGGETGILGMQAAVACEEKIERGFVTKD